MHRTSLVARLLIALVLLVAFVSPAAAKGTPYQTGFVRWRAAENGFASWTLGAVQLTGGALQLNAATAPTESDPYPAGGYNGGNYYTGGSFKVGEATSPRMPVSFAFTEAIASWNADTPAGTWIETQIRADFSGRWTKWYVLGIWAAGSTTIQRHSVKLQGDTDGYVSVDTLVLSNKKAAADAFQLKVRLFSVDNLAVPTVRNVSVAYSTSAPKKVTATPGNPRQKTVLTVPQCSQMVYPDGGNVWCSPTSTSMILGFWGQSGSDCETRVRAAVNGVYDWIYDGHGNWPFNTAYAATYGLEGYVARFTSMSQIEEWIDAGVPVAISYAWNKDLTGAPIPSSGGHLAVVVGFDESGNPIVNDPAAASDAGVEHTYLRSELEPLWLENSGGTVYLIYPPGWPVPSL